MADAVGKPITFVVPGQRALEVGATRGGASAAQSTSAIGGRVKESVRVGVSRGDSGEVRVTAVPGEDVVVLRIAGGPELMLHPETARDLLLAQSGGRPGGGTRGAAAPEVGEVQVPAQLQWRGREQASATRSSGDISAGDVMLSAVEVITDLITDKAADLLAGGVASRVDAQVENGVYRLERGALPLLKGTQMAATPNAGNGAPRLLVFLHGTFSNTSGTFGKLWGQHASLVRTLFDTYNDAVYALDHPTLGASPIANALTLAQWLPANARVHLVTHSRGGLVAEVLARVCGNTPLGEAELRSFTAEQRQELRALATVVAEKQAVSIASSASPALRAVRCSRRSGWTRTSPSSSGRSNWPVCL